MKTTHTLLAVITVLLIAACSSESKEAESQKETTSDHSEQLGKKTKAPIIDMSKFSEMSKADLRLARNTVYAKYGRVFESKDLKEHFAKQDWYHENPGFQESQMKQQDIDIVKLIQKWEEKTEVLLEERADITGNGSYEACYVLYNGNKGTYSIIVNDFSQEFDHFWGQADDTQGLPSDWAEIQAKIIDIDTEDFKQEVLVSQRYDEWVDPGTHNVIVAFDKGVKITELSSTDYDAGILEINGDGTVAMNFSNCPNHTKYYKLNRGKVVQFDEEIGPTPPGGCAACFTADAQVAVSMNATKPINELKRGDLVITYDQNSKTFYQTEVKRMLTVYHDNLVEINLGTTKLTVTDDHPFLTENGWCSVSPEKTMKRYGYKNVTPLTTGAKLIEMNGEAVSVTSIERVSEGTMTYTISTLENGNNFIVNGVVVGTETVQNFF
ncbi:MAG: YARHG domain-containing protein [bacterium]|nr:YARHG domain-containing protein [bacterium]